MICTEFGKVKLPGHSKKVTEFSNSEVLMKEMDEKSRGAMETEDHDSCTTW